MRSTIPTLAVTFLLALSSTEAQVKKGGGLFGFGRNETQISAGLFPSEPQASAPVDQAAEASSSSARTGEGIFRGGEPAPIEPVSYVIEDGQRVEREIREKRNFFAFGRRDREQPPEAAMMTEAPESPDSTVDSAPGREATPRETPTAIPVAEPRLMQDVPAEALAEPEEEKKGGGFFSFFSRNKDSKSEEPEFETMEPRTPVAEPVAKPVAATQSAPAEDESPAQGTESTMVEVPAAPQFADAEKPKKEEKQESEVGILPALPKIKIPRKPTNYENVETIIEDGEIVAEEESLIESNIVTQEPAGEGPPQVIDGVKTYSSWDDVDARSASAADKILNQIR